MTDLNRYPRGLSAYRLPILARVPADARVLDVGAWTGANGGYLAREAGLSVDGVELDPLAAAEAEGYQQMHVGSIEDRALQERLGRDYDAILFLDVLEHLVDPAAVLEAARNWLRPSGVVLCSIPNVANWRLRLGLLAGRFDYTETGLLDRTHLRWFTRKTAKQLLTDSGYRITWEDAVLTEPFGVRLPPRMLRTELFGWQFLIEATPA